MIVINKDNLKQKRRFILRQKRDKKSITGPQSVVTFYLGLYFPSSYSWNGAKLSEDLCVKRLMAAKERWQQWGYSR